MLGYLIQMHNMIKGTYIFYEDGKEIARSSNVITKFGKRFFTNSIAGKIADLSKSIAIGIDDTAATEDDTRLGFEFFRYPVSLGSTEITTVGSTTTYSVIYKTTIPQDISGAINEIGLYPVARTSLNSYDSKFITDASTSVDWISYNGFNPTESAAESRIGNTILVMDSNGTAEEEYSLSVKLDMSGYSLKDTLTVAYHKFDDNLLALGIQFYHTDGNAYYTEITPPVGTGPQISSDITIGSIFASSVGIVDQTQIWRVDVKVIPKTGLTTSIGLDGIRVNDEDTFDPIYGLISRSALESTVNKVYGRQLDIEYKVDLSF